MEYLTVDSPLHRLNPLTKLIGLAAIFGMGMLFSSPITLAALSGVLFILFKTAKATAVFKLYLRWLFWGGALLLALQILFSHNGPELLRFIPEDVPLFGWLGAINRDSLVAGLTMITRMAVFGFAMPLLLVTTQVRDLMVVLVDKFKFPYQYALMFITSLRFIPSLFAEIENILQAQRTRAFELKTKNPVKQVKAYLPLILPLVLISLQKAQRLAVAMETRGFGQGKRTYLNRPRFSGDDLAVSAGCCGGLLLMIILRVSGILT